MSGDVKAASVPDWHILTDDEVEAMTERPHPSDFVCHCEDPERIFDMEILEGSPSLTCQSCGKAHDHDDIVEINTTAPIPVRVRFVPEHPNLGGWHGMERCDHGWWFEVEALTASTQEAQPCRCDVPGEPLWDLTCGPCLARENAATSAPEVTP